MLNTIIAQDRQRWTRAAGYDKRVSCGDLYSADCWRDSWDGCLHYFGVGEDPNPTRDDQAEFVLCEVSDLALEIFSTTYGVDWQQSITMAVNMLPSLIADAEEWDRESELMRLNRLNRREVALMKQTGCSAEQAIDAIRAVDGKPAWSEVVNGRAA